MVLDDDKLFLYKVCYLMISWFHEKSYEGKRILKLPYLMGVLVSSHYMRNHMRICEFIHSSSSHELWFMINHMRVTDFGDLLISCERLWVLITWEIIWGYANLFHSASSHEFWLMRNHLRIRDFDILALYMRKHNIFFTCMKN